ncbi:hypothetical protein [Frondihabitans australicus]|uniref:D-mannose binding lectin n=1 Tax=Frondihabitans australicus TaxID=386892 RepID=A0A495IEV1_9MICO|nr:hypothetical protein [Frondihabitans australicus]RKR73536.1 D-mannose binding lectin [Frondihabitans australicus]
MTLSLSRPFSRRRLLLAAIALAASAAVVAAMGLAHPAHATLPQDPYYLDAGQGLTAGQSVYSVFNQYTLEMQSDGNLVEYGNGHALWQTRTSGAGNHLLLQTDGNLVVYSNKGKALWQSGSRGKNAELFVSDIDVWIQAGGYEIWSEHPADTHTATTGDVMTADQSLDNAVSRLTLQTDGNLVEWNTNRVTWSSGTGGNSGATLHVQKDGNVVIYSSKGKALWSTGTGGAGSSVVFTETSKGVAEVVKAGKVLWHAG